MGRSPRPLGRLDRGPTPIDSSLNLAAHIRARRHTPRPRLLALVRVRGRSGVHETDAVLSGRCAGRRPPSFGARPARVLLVDKGLYGSDTTTTHALMRGAVLQLHRWGVLGAIVAAGTPPVRSTTFSYSEQDVTVPIEPKFGVSALYAPRRALPDRVLVDAAADHGAEVCHGVRVDDVIVDDRGRVRGISAVMKGIRRRIDADIVIGADGRHSTIAQRVGAPSVVEGRHAAGVLYSYWEGLPADGYWRFQKGASIGTIPTNGGATCIFRVGAVRTVF